MYDLFLFLHVIGAVGLGFYLILPLILLRLKALSGNSLVDYLGGLYSTSRVMQYLLVVQLLIGGYLMSKIDYSVLWMVFSIGLLVVIGAISGIMNGKMKKAIKDLKNGGTGTDFIASIKMMSYIVTIALIVILYFMMFPQYA